MVSHRTYELLNVSNGKNFKDHLMLCLPTVPASYLPACLRMSCSFQLDAA